MTKSDRQLRRDLYRRTVRLLHDGDAEARARTADVIKRVKGIDDPKVRRAVKAVMDAALKVEASSRRARAALEEFGRKHGVRDDDFQ